MKRLSNIAKGQLNANTVFIAVTAALVKLAIVKLDAANTQLVAFGVQQQAMSERITKLENNYGAVALRVDLDRIEREMRAARGERP